MGVMKSNTVRETDRLLFNLFGYTTITVIAFLCLIPFLFVIAGSFTQEESIYRHGYSLWPKVFSNDAYRVIFESPKNYLQAFLLTAGITILGSSLGVFLTSMAAFVILQKDFKPRNFFAFFFYFTTIFSGGMIPNYILMVRYLELKNTLPALILPILLNGWYIIMMRSFMKSIPDSLLEAAKIDGANYFTIFIRIYFPLSTPALATIGMFIALAYWNDWYHSMLYAEKQYLYTLQYMLYKMVNAVNYAEMAAAEAGISMPRLPAESMKLSMTVVAIGPIIFLYPFVQKYFIKGLTVGAVKG